MNQFILIAFTVSIGFIFLYSLVQLDLIFKYFRARKKSKHSQSVLTDAQLPRVTVQLPIYNEIYVVERLIDTICSFDYPKSLLEIQVLDDSDDETRSLVEAKVQYYSARGFDIHHITRPDRIGYKAGALAHGAKLAKGEFIAIFDADFLPKKDFLKRTLPYFSNGKVGVIQTRWAYTNGEYSFLTSAQEFGLNGHFAIEQTARNEGEHFINFNGTAGIWRKSVIDDAGGWQADTLTEDLDLSYRAQLKGWKFIYLEDVESPSELPVEMNALRAQQFRWTKGAAQCVRKNLGKVLFAKDISLGTKIHAFFHLTNSSVFLFVFLLSILVMPVTIIKSTTDDFFMLTRLSSVFMVSWFILGAFYWVANAQKNSGKPGNLLSFLWKFPLFLAISMGLGLHNALAVAEGYIGKKSPFIRTPKFNVCDREDKWEGNRYTVKKVGAMTWLEGIMFVYALISLEVSIYYFSPGLLPMNILLVLGYGIVFFGSVIHWKRSVRQFKYREAF